ncbi:Disease resistance protein RPM1 [Acorus calamus]|uniref:Disease resistance protein RPM1 n=1 Tax=Acorus calamus TaxID=4465 RepID=A0AAV9D452_ACOCL|nr:Disease resistance protein RPM1 [Acorus calamus]
MAEAVVGFVIHQVGYALATELGKSLWSLSKEEASLLLALRIDMGEIKSELEMIQAFIRHADRTIMGDGPDAVWVGQVRETAYYIEDIIDEFIYFVGEQKSYGFWISAAKALQVSRNIKARHDIAMQLQEIKIKIKGIAERRIRYDVKGLGEGLSSNYARESPTSIPSFSGENDYIVGMESNIKQLMDWLTDDRAERMQISVFGMGGVGKTTLVNQVYKSKETDTLFECRAWTTVSNTYKTDEILRRIIEDLFFERDEMVPQGIDAMDTRRLFGVLDRCLQQKRYLIVLDDVWNESVSSEIRSSLPDRKCKSRIVFTTRNHEIASSLASQGCVLELKPLQNDQGWDLFCKYAFRGDLGGNCPPDLTNFAATVVKKCDGLPLAVVTLGGLLNSKRSVTEWTTVSNNLNWMLTNKPRLEKILNILMLSFHDLPYYLKNCFLYCSAFPEDHLIKRKRLIRLWIAEGFVEEREGMTMEEVAEDYLNELVQRSMIQVARKNKWGRLRACRMHDLVRELAISISKKQNFCMMLQACPIGRARRVSTIRLNNTIETELGKMSHLRSLLIFATGDMVSGSFDRKAKLSFKWLRVLDLEGTSIKSIPNAVGDLFNLKFLGLRRTNVNVLPKGLGRLQNLQTLDLVDSNVEDIPSGVIKLQKLRHVFIYYTVIDDIKFSVPMKTNPVYFWASKDLQTLRGIASNDEVVRQVGNLTQLKSFMIMEVRESDGVKLCASIKNMTFLHKLSVHATNRGKGTLKMETLDDPPPLLRKISLTGHLQCLPSWFGSLDNLRCLILQLFGLREDSLLYLQSLPNLVSLRLMKAYEGEKLCFQADAFRSLKVLYLYHLSRLNQIKFEDGLMQSLIKLHVVGCGELKMLPHGIEGLTALYELVLGEFPDEHLQRMRGGGVDHQKISHIPVVRHCFKNGGGWNFQNFE